MGAADAVEASNEEGESALDGRFDAAIECGGTPESWRKALRLARPGGRILFFSGLPGGTDVALDGARLHYSELTCIGAFHFTPADVREAYELLASGGIDVKPLVSGTERLANLSDVFARLDRRDGYKYALIPGSSEPAWA
jgi:L-iditol 2-dehydrogenase